ncbi:hypothetical protein DGMP_06360 [Desulfomarina profundi]|uniref:Uncharacterized protein n=2 Tax=Desulfomarina profundi TaxID=2772557 RepID=A0A8D5JCR0_9BACT|nr:hypothetical protein DGMP_06360 [Desulfomarina profundi]
MLATGLTIDEFAKKQGYQKASFYRTIKGTRRSKKIRAIIERTCAHIIKIDWPEPAKEKTE